MSDEPKNRADDAADSDTAPSSDSSDPEDRTDPVETADQEAEVKPDEDSDSPDGGEDPSEDPLDILSQVDFTSLRIRMFNVSCVFYVVMGGIAIFWMKNQGVLHTRLSTDPADADLTGSLMLGTAIAAAVFLFGAVARRTSDWAVAFEKEFAPLVNVFSYMQVPVLAFVSAAGEELFFRGALQEALGPEPFGLYLAAILFGLIHVPWKKRMIPWPVFAFVLGLLFGYIVLWTDSLYGPFLGHFLINLVNISLIKQRHPMSEDEIINQMMSG